MINLEYAEHQFRTEVTVDKDGVGRASIRGVARLADIDESSIRQSLSGAGLEGSKLAVSLTQQGFEGAGQVGWRSTGIPDLAVASILEYYAFHAGRYCTDNAKSVFIAFARMGIRVWMQNLTGWQRAGVPVDFQEFLTKQLPAKPKDWQCRYKPEFWAALEKVYGIKRGSPGCPMFITHWIYGYFPKEVMERIDEINPKVTGYSRRVRIHQHFDDVLELALEMQISLVTTNLIKAKSRSHFKRLMKGARRYSFTPDNLQALTPSRT